MDNVEIKINNSLENTNNIKIDYIKFKKMLLIYNALEEGWTIKKRNDSFIFEKKHEGKKEILLDSYLERFMKSNLDPSKLL
jgi:hypothetical protein